MVDDGSLAFTGELLDIGVEIIDVEFVVKSWEFCDLKSLLVLLSFKLRRRTGF